MSYELENLFHTSAVSLLLYVSMTMSCGIENDVTSLIEIVWCFDASSDLECIFILVCKHYNFDQKFCATIKRT